MITERVGEAFARPVEAAVRAFARFSPDVLTITGLALNGVACAFFAFSGGKDYTYPHLLRVGGVVALLASLFDMLDGRVARLRGRPTTFGAFLDSTMDRYSDMVLYLGLLILYARLDKTPHMVLVWVAAFGSFMTSYARARAESLIPRCTVGLLERPERIVLIVVGRAGEPDDRGALDHRGALERHRAAADHLHLRGAQARMDTAADRRDAPDRRSGAAPPPGASPGGVPSLPAREAAAGRRRRPAAAPPRRPGLHASSSPAAGARATRSARPISPRRRWRPRCPRARRPWCSRARRPPPWRLILTGITATFTKRVQGGSLFTFEDVAGLRATIEGVASRGGTATYTGRSTGRTADGAVAAEFDVTWSFKRRDP